MAQYPNSSRMDILSQLLNPVSQSTLIKLLALKLKKTTSGTMLKGIMNAIALLLTQEKITLSQIYPQV